MVPSKPSPPPREGPGGSWSCLESDRIGVDFDLLPFAGNGLLPRVLAVLPNQPWVSQEPGAVSSPSQLGLGAEPAGAGRARFISSAATRAPASRMTAPHAVAAE